MIREKGKQVESVSGRRATGKTNKKDGAYGVPAPHKSPMKKKAQKRASGSRAAELRVNTVCDVDYTSHSASSYNDHDPEQEAGTMEESIHGDQILVFLSVLEIMVAEIRELRMSVMDNSKCEQLIALFNQLIDSIPAAVGHSVKTTLQEINVKCGNISFSTPHKVLTPDHGEEISTTRQNVPISLASPDKPQFFPKSLNFSKEVCQGVVEEKFDSDQEVEIIKQRSVKERSPKSRINPDTSRTAIVKFLFDPSKSQRESVVDYPGKVIQRCELSCLMAQQEFLAVVIDFWADLLNFEMKEQRSVFNKIYFSTGFSAELLGDFYTDGEIYTRFLSKHIKEVQNELGLMFIPMYDKESRHWFLCIIDFDDGYVCIWDSSISGLRADHRRGIVKSAVERLGKILLEQEDVPKKYHDISRFSVEYAKWIPQTHSYDSGLYVCLLMKAGQGFCIKLTEEESRNAREGIAVDLYRSHLNDVAYPHLIRRLEL